MASGSQQEVWHASADVKLHVGLPLIAVQPSSQVTAEHATWSLQQAAFLVSSVAPATSVLDSHALPESQATGAADAHVSSTGARGVPHFGKGDCLHLCHGADGGPLALLPRLLLHGLETGQIQPPAWLLF